MESTTLVTFMLQHPTARKVELLGSWDNFSEPYSMELDRRRGRDFWSGCHSFRNIICDGDEDGIHEKRSGGLKMGGTYWYFYRIDGDDEFHDPTQETTTACPLMPGQTMNVLEVPLDVGYFGSHSRSASTVSLLNIVKTLDPQDRYTNPKPVAQAQPPETTTSTKASSPARHLPPSPGTDAEPAGARRRSWQADGAAGAENQRHQSRHRPQRLVRSAPASIADNAGADSEALFAMRPWQHEGSLLPRQGGYGDFELAGDQSMNLDFVAMSTRNRLNLSELDSPASNSIDSLPELIVGGDWPLLDERPPSLSYQDILSAHESHSISSIIDSFPALPERNWNRLYANYGGLRRGLHQKASSSSASSRRSVSLGQEREPSPLRHLALDQDEVTRDYEYTTSPGFASADLEGHLSIDLTRVSLDSCHGAIPATDADYSNNSYPVSANDEPLYQGGIQLDDRSATPSFYLLPAPQPYHNEAEEMNRALEALNAQYTQERHYSPWHSVLNIPLPESPETSQETYSEAGSPIFSSIHGDVSDTCTSHRLSELLDWPLKQHGSDRLDFRFDERLGPNQSFEQLSIHTTNTDSTTGTALPYQLPRSNPFAASKASIEPAADRELTHTEQLLDEFEYLGAALL